MPLDACSCYKSFKFYNYDLDWSTSSGSKMFQDGDLVLFHLYADDVRSLHDIAEAEVYLKRNGP